MRGLGRALLWATLLVAALPDPGRAQVFLASRGSAQRRTLVYRGARELPSPRRALGSLATVHHWEEELHELEIELDGDQVSAVQSRVRRRRASG